MTISHVIYLEFARLIVSWQWVTEVSEKVNTTKLEGDTVKFCIRHYKTV